MSKTTVTRLFVGAIVAVVTGGALAFATVIAALVGGVVSIGGPTAVSVNGDALARAIPWLVIAGLAATGGAIAAIASWIGALLNTFRLDDKTWFVTLLVLGVLSLGWVAIVAYIVAGPDGKEQGAPHAEVATVTRM
jgi:hypothetical protein